jgi:raffinose/stachyose/melibiose transport system permease protein
MWLLPLAIYTSVFVIPCVLGLIYSFTNWTIYSSTKTFAGFGNYLNLLVDSMFKMGFRNTILFAVLTTAFKSIIGFSLALALNRALAGRNILRTVFYMPGIFSSLILGVVFKSMLMPSEGLINSFFGLFSQSLAANDWLGQPETAMAWVIIVEIWKGCGYCMVIFLAGLQSIAADYYEAATIGGAGGWQKFRAITLPLMLPSININVSLSLIGGLKVFDIIIALTRGGPGFSTEVLSTTVYKYLGNGALGTGSAANIVLSLFVVLVFFTVNNALARLEVDQ